jgi:hypothetical protein
LRGADSRQAAKGCKKLIIAEKPLADPVPFFRSPAMLLIAVALAGCAFGYQARGTLGDVPGEMRGKGYPDNTRGGGRFILDDREGRLTCEGVAQAPSRPGEPGSCVGEAGEGVVRCSDGRTIPIAWHAITCRSWQGSGEDAAGIRLEFRVERLSR